MADNETSYLPIGTCLEQIEQAVYGREVRKAIHDGIAQCYDDTVEGVNAAQQAASDTQDVINNAVTATNAANTAAAEASNVKVEQTVSGDTVTFTTTKRDGSTVSTSFQKPNIVVSKDEGSGEFSVTAKGWNGEEIVAKIPDPSEEVKSRATIAAVSKVETALGNPLTITDGMDAPAVKTVVTLEPKQDLHGYDHPWVGGAGKNLCPVIFSSQPPEKNGYTFQIMNDGSITVTGTWTGSSNSVIGSAVQTKFNLPAGEYILNGAYADAFNNHGILLQGYDWTNDNILLTNTNGDVPFTLSQEIQISIRIFINSSKATTPIPSGGIVLRPMIRLATEADATYEPYSNICPIEGYDNVRVTATGKNLLKPTVTKGITNNGITYTLNGDGSITANGTATAASNINITSSDPSAHIPLPKGKYILSGCPANGSASTYALRIREQNIGGGKTAFLRETGSGVELNVTDTREYARAYIEIANGATVNNVTFYPMIRRADDNDPTYEQAVCYDTSLSVAQAAGATVYGGTVTLNEDGSGTLVVDRAIYTADGSEKYGATSSGANRTLAYSELPDARKLTSAVYIVSNGIAVAAHSDGVKGIAVSGRTGISGYAIGVENDALGIDDTATVDQRTQAIKTYLTSNPIQFVYYLDTPTIYSLTASQLRTLTGENHVWTDGTKLELTYRADKYADVDKFLNAIPTGTKTGDPAMFADGADDLPFEKLTIAVEPHQEGSGDPSPDNVRPITGWDEVKVTRFGKNLFDPAKAEMIVIDAGNTQRYGCSFDNLPAGQYTVSVVALGDTIDRSVFYKYYNGTGYSSSTRITNASTGSGTVSLPEGCRAFVYIDATNASTGSNALENVIGIQFEAGSTATSYEPYTYTTLPIPLKYATGSTVYGGTVTINRDGTGSVVVDKCQVILDGVKNKVSVLNSGTANYMYKYSSGVAYTGNVTTGEPLYCNQYTFQGNGVGNTNTTQGLSVVSDGTIRIRDGEEVSADAFNARLAANPVQVVFNMATPITYTLTAPQLTSLLGNNTVWCDAGQVTVKYKRDIGKMISNLYAMLVDTGAIVIENEEDVTVEGPGYP